MLDASGLTQQAVQGDAETQQGAVAFEMLRADIVSCRIAPGSNVSEAELASRYGLGKPAIRRALDASANAAGCRRWRAGYVVKTDHAARHRRDLRAAPHDRADRRPPRGRARRRQPAAPARRGVPRWFRRRRCGEPGNVPAGAPPAASIMQATRDKDDRIRSRGALKQEPRGAIPPFLCDIAHSARSSLRSRSCGRPTQCHAGILDRYIRLPLARSRTAGPHRRRSCDAAPGTSPACRCRKPRTPVDRLQSA